MDQLCQNCHLSSDSIRHCLKETQLALLLCFSGPDPCGSIRSGCPSSRCPGVKVSPSLGSLLSATSGLLLSSASISTRCLLSSSWVRLAFLTPRTSLCLVALNAASHSPKYPLHASLGCDLLYFLFCYRNTAWKSARTLLAPRSSCRCRCRSFPAALSSDEHFKNI